MSLQIDTEGFIVSSVMVVAGIRRSRVPSIGAQGTNSSSRL